MSDIMLINPSSKEILENAGDRPPLGLLYLGAILKRRGHDVRVRDMDHFSNAELVNEVESNPPDYAGISVYTSPLYNHAVELARYLNGKCKTIAGGYHATALPLSLTPYFDTVIIGEGEKALPKIIEEDLDGIVEGEHMDIETIPKPARDLVDMKKYNFKQDDRPATTLLSSRGCPNSCVYCGNMNRKMRYNSDFQVIDELRELKKMGYNDVYFYDDAFSINKKRTMRLLDKIKLLRMNYRITTRAKSLDEDLLKSLSDSGCTWISLGIESGSEDRLIDIKKNMTKRDNYNAVKSSTKYGIKTKGFFMFGLPNESREDAQKTIDFSQVLKYNGLTTANFYIMTPFPGTPIWNKPEDFGIEILDRDYTKYLEVGKGPAKAFHRTKFMEQDEIQHFRDKAEAEWNKN